MERYSVPNANRKCQGHLVETDGQGLQRVAFREEGWKYYDWRGYKTHYIEAGMLILIHIPRPDTPRCSSYAVRHR